MGGLSRFVGQCVLKGESRCALLFKKKLFVLFLLNVSETFSIDCIICYRKYYMEKFTFWNVEMLFQLIKDHKQMLNTIISKFGLWKLWQSVFFIIALHAGLVFKSYLTSSRITTCSIARARYQHLVPEPTFGAALPADRPESLHSSGSSRTHCTLGGPVKVSACTATTTTTTTSTTTTTTTSHYFMIYYTCWTRRSARRLTL